MCPLRQAIWRLIWTYTVEKSKQMQPVWLCICRARPFENTQWGKDKQMQPVWICMLRSKFFQETFEKTQWEKIDQAGAFHRIYCPMSISIFHRLINQELLHQSENEFDHLQKKIMIIMIQICTKSHYHRRSWWRWRWWVRQIQIWDFARWDLFRTPVVRVADQGQGGGQEGGRGDGQGGQGGEWADQRRKMFQVATCGVWRSTTDGCSEEAR